MPRAILIPIEGDVEVITPDKLADYQRLVGGSIEHIVVGLPDGNNGMVLADGYINEDGKMLGLPMNQAATEMLIVGDLGLPGDYVVGPLVLIGDSDTLDLPDEVVALVDRYFRLAG